MRVSIPWNLPHYMPLNGFHPLYESLFTKRSKEQVIYSWDNVELSELIKKNNDLQKKIVEDIGNVAKTLDCASDESMEQYWEHFDKINIYLTANLPGEVEIHHTAPFPSFKKPFVLHCESFAPIFFPYSHQGMGKFENCEKIRKFYKQIFEHSMCIGIYSHLEQTLNQIKKFFLSDLIDSKLRLSPIGIDFDESKFVEIDRRNLDSPTFVFMNSANQNPNNFVLRGGHIVLRFWRMLYPDPSTAKLIMRCHKPSNEILKKYFIDVDWLEYRSDLDIIWVNSYLTPNEIDNLVSKSDFFLLPSSSLHSVSIMKALSYGVLPVVSDTLGTEKYIQDNVDGIVIKGVKDSNWVADSDTGILYDSYTFNSDLDNHMVEQLFARIKDILSNKNEYYRIVRNGNSKYKNQFYGDKFSDWFWDRLNQDLYKYKRNCLFNAVEDNNLSVFSNCVMDDAGIKKAFASPPQPIRRLNTGYKSISEFSGIYVLHENQSMKLHDWSPLSNCVYGADQLVLANEIKEFGVQFLAPVHTNYKITARLRLINYLRDSINPTSFVYRIAKILYRLLGLSSSKQNIHEYVDIELVEENYKGFNLIRNGTIYYAILPSHGEFIPSKADSGGYAPSFKATNLRGIYKCVDVYSLNNDIPVIYEEGYRGYNIIKFNDMYYGIKQTDGPFLIEKINNCSYDKSFADKNPSTIKCYINASGNDNA